MTMLHYTLNSGHCRTSPRAEVRDDVLRTLAPLLAAGEHDLPLEGYRLSVTTPPAGGLLATVFAVGPRPHRERNKRPCVTIAVAPDAEAAAELWPAVLAHYHQITELPGIRAADFAAAREPPSTPWCAAIVIVATPEEAHWLGDFERCLAWAWLEKQ